MENFDLMSDIDQFVRSVSHRGGSTIVHPQTSGGSLDAFYSRLESMGINLEELRPVFECKNNLLILSGAGSGKTTSLVLKLIHDLLSGDMMKSYFTPSVYGHTEVKIPARILVSTFLRSGAEELRSAFVEWCNRLNIVGIDISTIRFRTIHAEVKDAITDMGVKVEILEEFDSLARSVMQKYKIRSVTATSRNTTAEEVSDFISLLAYARNRLDDQRYMHPLMQEFNIDAYMLDAVLQDMKLMRSALGKLDFEDLQEMLLEALRSNEHVRQFIANRYDYIFVDEFQDTSQLQYELLKYYFAGSKRVLVIGDDDQCIYSWRGSDPNIITHRFEQDYSPVVLKLTTNYRCRSNILNFIKPSIEKNTNRHPKQLRSAKEGGTVYVISGADVNSLVDNILKDLSQNMTVGVLARTNADLLVPAILLELHGGIDFSLSKAVTLNSRLGRQIFGIIDLVTKRYTDEFESFLKLFVPRYNWFEVEKLCEVLVQNKHLNLYNIPQEDLSNSVPSLWGFLEGLRKAKQVGDVEAYLYILEYMNKNVYTGFSMYSHKARELLALAKKLILEHKDIKNLSIGQIDDLFNNVLPERLNRRIKYSRDTFVKLSTVHEAKGKEWDSVYIWNDIEGTFPNIVGNRDITQDEFEEERRVHYIAVTRARYKVTIYTDNTRMSPFLKECDMRLSNVEGIMKDGVMSKPVFRAAKPEEQFDVAGVLRKYITETLELRDYKDERYVNLELLLNKHTVEDLLEEFQRQYDGSIIDKEMLEVACEQFIARKVQQMFQTGDF